MQYTELKKTNTEPLNKSIGNLFKFLFLGFIQTYRLFFSNIFGGSCRFYPSCSVYGEEAFKEFGFFKALTLTLKRVLKCYPFGPKGFDPLPTNHERQCLNNESK